MGENADNRITEIPNGSAETDKNRSTEAAGTAERAGTGAGTGAGAGTEAEKEKAGAGVAVVAATSEEEKRKKRNAARRANYEKKKKEREAAGIAQRKPEQVAAPVQAGEVPEQEEKKPAPKKRRTSKKKKDVLSSQDLNKIFMPLVGVIASRPGMEHWSMTEEEITTVTEPLAEILGRMDALNKFQSSAEISLIIACVALFVPRGYISIQKGLEKKKHAKGNTLGSAGNKLDEGRKSRTVTEGRKSESTHKRDDKKPAADGSPNGAVYDILGASIAY